MKIISFCLPFLSPKPDPPRKCCCCLCMLVWYPRVVAVVNSFVSKERPICTVSFKLLYLKSRKAVSLKISIQMEITPMLDAGSRASQGIWYLLSAENEGPCPRVGHASLVVNHRFKDVAQGSVAAGAASQENQGSMVIVAGATPSGPFNDVYFLEISK